MNRLFFVFIFLGFIHFSNAQDLKWSTDMKSAIEQSIKTKKPLMLFFTGSDWCGWCIRLQNEVFKTADFVTWANKYTIPVELDFPRRTKLDPALQKQNNDLASEFGVRGFPTVHFVKPVKKGSAVEYDKLGNQGYMAGGPSNWIAAANKLISK